MKRCGRCGGFKATDEFGYRNKSEGRRHSVCKSCQRIYRADYVQRVGRPVHHARVATWISSYRSSRRVAIEGYLRDHPCVDCGEADLVVLDFDHVRDVKIASISAMIRDRMSMELVWAEIAKCEVRCANCHRRKTARTLWHRPPLEEGIVGAEPILRSPPR